MLKQKKTPKKERYPYQKNPKTQNGGFSYTIKNIKLIVRKQLKKQFPNWKRLPEKIKKGLAWEVLAEVVAEYDFKQEIEAPKNILAWIESKKECLT